MLKFTAWQQAEPEMKLTLWIFAVSALIQAAVAGCLFCASWNWQRDQGRQWELSAARCLAASLAQALEAQDDLLALALLREAPGHYPQLREGRVFDLHGKILWHTDSSQIGKKTGFLPQARGVGPDIFTGRTQGGRPITSVEVPLSEDSAARLQLVFDETSRVQAGIFFGIQTLILLLLAAGGITYIIRKRLGSYAIFDRREKSLAQDAGAVPDSEPPLRNRAGPGA